MGLWGACQGTHLERREEGDGLLEVARLNGPPGCLQHHLGAWNLAHAAAQPL